MRRKLYDDRGTDQSNAKDYQQHQTLEEVRKAPGSPGNPLILDFYPPQLWENKVFLF